MRTTIAVLILALGAAACTKVTPLMMPDGNQGYSISCPPGGAGTQCMQKAAELCPYGYQVVGSGGTQYSNFSMSNGYATGSSFNRPQLLVECR